jgi:luciferase family oxidoreductase group 1
VVSNVQRLSVLDVSPVPAGTTPSQALANSVDLARLADRLGYTRYWLAEHHNTAGIASSSPEVMIAHIATQTERIRVGSGGIMLPNHSALHVAETFKVLEALHPGRIDLGLGRAPGTDARTALALRRSPEVLRRDTFPTQLGELLAFLGDGPPEGHPFHGVTAVPRDGSVPELWMLGSSDYGAQVAAQLGMGFAFAHHINPAMAIAALRAYRAGFQPSDAMAEPTPILGVAAVCAETAEEAEILAATIDLVWLRIGQGRTGLPVPSLEEALAYEYSTAEEALRRGNRNRFWIGTGEQVAERLDELAGITEVAEVMVMTMVHDHAARRRSYELLATARGISPAPAYGGASPAGV